MWTTLRGPHTRRNVSLPGALVTAYLLLLVTCTCASGASSPPLHPPSTATTTTTAVPLRLCHIPVSYIDTDRTVARHAAFAATQYFAPLYPEFNITYTFATLDGGSTLPTIVRGILDSMDDCHMLIGPQWSSVSIAMSPVVRIPWLSHFATSTALSDKSTHPWFSRTPPNDAIGGASQAAALAVFGWTVSSAIVIDDAYGRSLYQGYLQELQRTGGSIEQTVLVLTDTTIEELRERMRPLRTVRYRLLNIIGSSSHPAVSRMFDVLEEWDMLRTFVLNVGETACANGWERLSQLPGVICSSYVLNDAAVARYEAAWQQHDPAAFAYFEDFGVPTPVDPRHPIVPVSAFAVDAVHVALEAFRAQLRSGGNLSDGAAVNDHLRNVTVLDGLTGNLTFDANGDREQGLFALFNIRPNASSPLGYTRHAYGRNTDDGALRTDPGQQYWTIYGGFGPDPDVDTYSSDTSFAPSPTLLVVMLASVALLLLLAGLLAKIGCAEDGMFLHLLHSGLLGSAVIGLLNFLNVILSILSLLELLDSEHSTLFVAVFGAATVLGCIASVAEIGVIVAFIWMYLSHDGGMPLNTLSLWHQRSAIAAVVALLCEDVPMTAVCTAGLALQPNEPSIFVVMTLLLNSITLGAKVGDVRFLFRWGRSGVEGAVVQVRIKQEFADHVPLTRRSDYFIVNRVTQFIGTCSKIRQGALVTTAKRIVVNLRKADVAEQEFFAVVWNIMGDLYMKLDGLDNKIAIAERRKTRASVMTSENASGRPRELSMLSSEGDRAAQQNSTTLLETVFDERGASHIDDQQPGAEAAHEVEDEDDDDDFFDQRVDVQSGVAMVSISELPANFNPLAAASANPSDD